MLVLLLHCVYHHWWSCPVAADLAHGRHRVSEAIFTSTSAVTVTGLVLADTGAAFTGFGQAVIAILIQLGGLGLMTFAVLVLGASVFRSACRSV